MFFAGKEKSITFADILKYQFSFKNGISNYQIRPISARYKYQFHSVFVLNPQ